MESLLPARPSGAAREGEIDWRGSIVFTVLTARGRLAGCMPVGPDFLRPAAIVSPQFKEIAGWKIATPRASESKGDWWSIFHDPELGRLEGAVADLQPDGQADEANYRERDRAYQ